VGRVSRDEKDVAREKKFSIVPTMAAEERPLDLEEIERLAAMMERCGLDELELERAGCRLRLGRCRGSGETILSSPVCVAPAALSQGPAEGREVDLQTICSPMIGSFYRSSSPGKPAFVEIGSAVSVDTTVCIIEAMKVMNEIPADVEGVLVEVLARDGQVVEFGQPLFKVAPQK
jgi:acetyl-CoA carboxylase biotin carboxyl carrier protein